MSSPNAFRGISETKQKACPELESILKKLICHIVYLCYIAVEIHVTFKTDTYYKPDQVETEALCCSLPLRRLLTPPYTPCSLQWLTVRLHAGWRLHFRAVRPSTLSFTLTVCVFTLADCALTHEKGLLTRAGFKASALSCQLSVCNLVFHFISGKCCHCKSCRFPLT